MGFLEHFNPFGSEKEEEGEEKARENALKPERRVSPVGTEEEEVLSARETVSSKDLAGGTNTIVRVELKDDGSGIFKPRDGERESGFGVQ